MTSQAIRLKLLAALVALGCGIGAIVTVYELYQATPAATSIPAASPSAAPAPPAPAPAASSAQAVGSPSFPNPPAGAVVLAKEDRDLAVALAVMPTGLAQASVVGQEGPASGLSVSVDAAPARACGAGCYRARLGNTMSRTVQVSIRGPHRPESTVSFQLPLAAPSATAIVRRAERTWRGLETLVVHDHLSSGPGSAVDTVWRFKAPHRMTYQIRNGPAAVSIGARRWDKLPGQRWEPSQQDPITEPIPLWESVSDAHLLGSTTLRGRAVWQVSFFDAQIPAWFTIWVDKASGRTLELRMVAQAHFMHQVYGPFNSPLTIVPPV